MTNIYWKIFKENIFTLVEKGNIGWEFMLIPAVIILYLITAFLISRKNIKACRIIQVVSLLILGVFFLQCLCLTKQLMLGFKYLFKGEIALFLAMFWLAGITFVFVGFLSRKFYCNWICPLGFAQDLTRKAELNKKNKKLSLFILIFLFIALGIFMFLFHPIPVVVGAGAWLGLIIIFISILVLKYPEKERQISRLRYLLLLGWAALFIVTPYKLSGPWCVLGQANLKYAAIIPFLCVILVSIIIPRAWCRYGCPDGALLQLINKKKGAID